MRSPPVYLFILPQITQMGADWKELHGTLIPVFICVHLRHLRFIFFLPARLAIGRLPDTKH